MSNYLAKGVLASDVAVAGTFTVAYPSGTSYPGQSQDIGGYSNQSSKADFIYAFGHYMMLNGSKLLAPESIGLSFGTATASTPGNVTVTNKTAATLKAGSEFILNLVTAKQLDFVTIDGKAVPHCKKLGGGRFKIGFGNPVAKSTTALLATATVTDTSNQLASAGTYDLVLVGVSPQGRGLQYVSSSASDTAITVTCTGVDIYNVAMTETATLNGTTPVLGKKAFSKVSSIVASGSMVGTLSVGTTNLFGFPMFAPTAGLGYITELANGIVPTAGTLVAGIQTAGGSTATTGDVRGTWLPNTTTDGSVVYEIILTTVNEDYLGPVQA